MIQRCGLPSSLTEPAQRSPLPQQTGQRTAAASSASTSVTLVPHPDTTALHLVGMHRAQQHDLPNMEVQLPAARGEEVLLGTDALLGQVGLVIAWRVTRPRLMLSGSLSGAPPVAVLVLTKQGESLRDVMHLQEVACPGGRPGRVSHGVQTHPTGCGQARPTARPCVRRNGAARLCRLPCSRRTRHL